MSTSTSSSGIGLCGALLLIFVVLKLTEVGAVAGWSWWWVLSPIWIPWGIVLVLAAVLYPLAALGDWLKTRSALKRLSAD